MFLFLRGFCLLFPGVFLATMLSAQAADNQTNSVAPPVAVPAFLDVVSFEFQVDGENHKAIVTMGPTLVRVDEPEDHYSIIYNPQTDHYTGLEHGNYTYWEFSWPEIRAAVENSKRHETRLQELSNEGLSIDSHSSAATNAPNAGFSSTSSDDSGYVWRATTDRKPVRTIVPDFIFPVYDALAKGGVIPILITWGGDKDKSHFRFVEAKTRDGKLSLFTVPKLYMKTTLVTMDGLIDQQPVHPERKSAPAPKTWQN